MKKIIMILFVGLILTGYSFAQCSGCVESTCSEKKAKITFIELGSVNCIPCKKMEPVLKSVETKFGEQINVVFYDVWKEENKKYKEEYKVRLIPTQVFLDSNGKEIHRHEGFYPEEEIIKFLKKQGLKVVNKVN